MNTAQYPEFSWDHVPLYMHIRKDKRFSAEELAFISRFPIITFEKRTGIAEDGSTEAGTQEAAKAVKALNPKAKVLFYWNVIVYYGLYEANEALATIENWQLKGFDGKPHLIRGTQDTYNLSDREFRDWWIRTCANQVNQDVIDGVFLDGNIKVLYPPFLAQVISAEESEVYRQCYDEMMVALREAIGPDKLMHANIIRGLFPDAGLSCLRKHFDGSYLECFETVMDGSSYEAYVAKGIAAVQQAAKEGHLITFHMGPKAVIQNDVANKKIIVDDSFGNVDVDADSLQKRFEYCLAMFLIFAEKYSYFNFTPGYGAEAQDLWKKWYPEYDRPLGAPKGDACQDGYVYTREFEHCSVWLDIENRTGALTWG